MIFSDGDIRKAIGDGRIGIDPFRDDLVQPASIDVTLGNRFIEFKTSGTTIDPLEGVPAEDYHGYDADVMVLWPQQFVLASTVERITLPSDITARVEGKSSLARLGLLVHVTAGFIDPGFSGEITLEIVNLAPRPIRLYAGMAIAQIGFFGMGAPSRHPYGSSEIGSKYQHQAGPVTSRYEQNAHQTHRS